MKVRNINTYSAQTAEKYINEEVEVFCISTAVRVLQKYDKDNKKYTDEVDGYSAFFVIAGDEPFKVKFAERQDLQFLQPCKFENLQAIEINRNVYFKAKKVVF